MPQASSGLFVTPTIPLGSFSRHYDLHLHDERTCGYEQGGAIDSIRFDNGSLFVGDMPILEPHFGIDQVTWQQQVKDRYLSGHLYFTQGGVSIQGVVSRGKSAISALPVPFVGTSLVETTFKTRLSTRRFPSGTKPGQVPAGDWADGLDLKIAVGQAIGDLVPAVKVFLGGEELPGADFTFAVTSDSTILKLNLENGIFCLFGDFYLTGEAVFPVLVPSPELTGRILTRCSELTPNGEWVWKGTQVPAADAKPLRERETLTITREDLAPSPQTLTIAELMTLIPDAEASNLAHQMLVENMKWALGQNETEKGWLEAFFGERVPAIGPERETLVKKSLDWYQEEFAKSYLGWAISNYSGPNQPTVKLTDAQTLKLKNYMEEGLAKTSDYTLQQQGIYLDAYITTKKRLKDYIADGGEKWARALYQELVKPQNFTLILARVWGGGGLKGALTPANNFASILTALQPEGTHARQYMEDVMTATVTQLSQRSTVMDDTQIMQWLPDFLTKFLQQAATGGKLPDSAKLAAEELKQFLASKSGDMFGVAKELASFVVAAGGQDILQKTNFATTAFAEKHPNFARVGKMIFYAAWTTGLIMSIQAFLNWDSLPPREKAEAITIAVLLGLQAIEIVPALILGVRDMGIAGWKMFTNYMVDHSTGIGVRNMLRRFTDRWLNRALTETSALFDGATKKITPARSIFSKVFSAATKVIAVIGVVITVAFAVFSTLDFIDAILSGQPITNIIFNGLLAVTGALTVVCLIVDLIVVTTVFAWAAGVLAIVGLILSIVMMFAFKPENPLDRFMRDVIIPFVDTLPDPAGSAFATGLLPPAVRYVRLAPQPA